MEDIDYAAKAKERRRQIHANIGHTLCEFRKDAGYSLEEAADLIGYKPEKLQKVEEGGRISVPAFMRIVATYGGHVFIDAKTGTYSLEELYQVPPITQEEIESMKISKELERKVNAQKRNRDWLNRMSDNWDDDNE